MLYHSNIMAEKQKPLILVVDDDPAFLEIFSAALSAAGFSVETAQDGPEGIEKARQLMPALVLMDVRMPVMSGVEAFLKIKADPVSEGVKIIFLTNLGDPRMEMQEINRRLAKEIGAVGYIKKTDDLDTMVDRVRHALGV